MIVPAPVQAAMVAALGDDEHVREQRARYATAPRAAACRVRGAPAAGSTHSEAGLYLWVTRDEDCWDVGRGAGRARDPGRAGRVLRPAGARHVRVALTATDERVAAAAARMSAPAGT